VQDKERKLVFFVDDNLTSLVIVRDALNDQYDVITFDSPERMFKTIEKALPDIILMDVEMPGMSGYGAIKILKSNPRTARIPVIFVTGNNSWENEAIGFSQGAADYITKPFSPQTLRKRIEMHLLLETQRVQLESGGADKTSMGGNNRFYHALLNSIADLIEFRSLQAVSHAERAGRCFKLIIEAMQKREICKDELEAMDLEAAVQSVCLHDIGKLWIDGSILKKPGKLSPQEFDIMQGHTVIGGAIIKSMLPKMEGGKMLAYAEVLATSHHEKWDGSGYPSALKGGDIPLLGRIMAIADVYDALVCERPYRQAYSHNKALEIMADAKGSHFEPVLLEAFLEVSGELEKAGFEKPGAAT